MTYDKPIMTKRELRVMGFTNEFLQEAYRIGECAFKSSTRRNATLLYNTEKLEKYRKAREGL